MELQYMWYVHIEDALDPFHPKFEIIQWFSIESVNFST
jgi:hypothetical protein